MVGEMSPVAGHWRPNVLTSPGNCGIPACVIGLPVGPLLGGTSTAYRSEAVAAADVLPK